MKKITTLAAVLLTCWVSSFGYNNYYLMCNQIFSDEQDAQVYLYNYNYYYGYDNSQIEAEKVKYILYSVPLPSAVFITKNISNPSVALNDSMLKLLPVHKQWTEDFDRKQYYKEVNLGKLPEGVYVLESFLRGEISHIPIVISNWGIITKSVNNHLIAFVTDKKTGEVISDFTATAFVNNEQISPVAYKKGLAVFDANNNASYYSSMPIMIMKDKKMSVNMTYLYNYYYYYNQQPAEKIYVYTDQSAYRPDNWVRFKGIARILEKEGFDYNVPKFDTVYYSIYDNQSQQVTRKFAVMDANGTFVDSIYMDKNRTLGQYTIRVRMNTAYAENEYYYSYGQEENNTVFQLEEFKKPEFEVLVNPEKTQYSNGDEVTATVNAKYFFGSPVTNADMEWKVVREQIYRPWYWGYSYSWWYEDFYGDYYEDYYNANNNTKIIAGSGSGKLNADGTFEIKYTTEKDNSTNYKYTIVADVMDASRRTISGVAEVKATATDYMLNAYSESYYYEEKDLVRINASATDFNYTPVDADVTVKVYSSKNYNYSYNNYDFDLVREFSQTLKANEYGNEVSFTADQSGYYKVVVEGKDKNQNTVSAECYAYVINPEQSNYWWWQNSGGQIQIMTSKKVYNAGEDIEAMVYLPHSSNALVTLNGQAFAYYGVQEFKQNRGEEADGAFQKIVIPTDKNVYGKLELGIAYYKNSQFYNHNEKITLIPDQQYLDVTISYDEDKYKPGDLADAVISVVDKNGNPVSGANLSFGITDESIYSLYPDKNKSINEVFYNGKGTFNSYYSYQQNWSVYDYSSTASAAQLNWRQRTAALILSKDDVIANKEYSRGFSYNKTGDQAYLTGIIFDYETGEVVPSASLTFKGNTYKTDKLGFFMIEIDDTANVDLKIAYGAKRITLENLQLTNTYNQTIYACVSAKTKSVDMKDQMVEYMNSWDAGGEGETLDEVSVSESRNEDATMTFGGTVSLNSVSVGKSASVAYDFADGDKDGADLGFFGGDNNKKLDIGIGDAFNKQTIDFKEAIVRSAFKDNLMWIPNLTTDGWGKAKVKITIPDNLTTWRSIVKVITADSKVGEALAKFTVTKNLLVRMETPRFMTLGDELLIATNIHNYLPTEKIVKVSLEADGVTMEGTEQIITVSSKGEYRIDWKINADFLKTAKLTIRALTDEESDAMVMEVPVLPYGLEMVQAFSAYASGTNDVKINFNIDEFMNMNSVKLELNTSSSITSALLASMDQLIGYPYGCVEQTMSRFLPNAIVANTIENLGNNYQSGIDKKELEKMVAAGAARLKELQHEDGGWGWWENDANHPFMTAYVVNGLHIAKAAGYPIDEVSYNNGKSALQTLIQNKTTDDRTTAAYQQVVAQRMGLKNLWSAKLPDMKDSNPYELALWLQAASYAKDEDAISEILPLLKSQAIKEGTSVYWGGKKFYYSWQDDQIETTANAVQALLMADPTSVLIPGAVQWLMNKREGNAWHNTRETAMCIYAMSDMIKAEMNPDLEYEVYCNGNYVAKKKITGADIYQKGLTVEITEEEILASIDEYFPSDKKSMLHRGENNITLKQTGTGFTYMNAKLVYYKAGGEITSEEKANQPFDVTREYFKLEKKTQNNGTVTYKKIAVKADNIHPGDDILVKVAVNSKSAHEYILMEDPIPAGCEFVRDASAYVIDGETLQFENPTQKYYWWNWNNWYTHKEYRDTHLAMTITNLYSGAYSYAYILKAQIPGTYNINPSTTCLMYYPEVRGFSDFASMVITE